MKWFLTFIVSFVALLGIVALVVVWPSFCYHLMIKQHWSLGIGFILALSPALLFISFFITFMFWTNE